MRIMRALCDAVVVVFDAINDMLSEKALMRCLCAARARSERVCEETCELLLLLCAHKVMRVERAWRYLLRRAPMPRVNLYARYQRKKASAAPCARSEHSICARGARFVLCATETGGVRKYGEAARQSRAYAQRAIMQNSAPAMPHAAVYERAARAITRAARARRFYMPPVSFFINK